MKIECQCGERIADTTDFISYKAFVVADQDRNDLVDGIVTSVQRLVEGRWPAKKGSRLNDAIFRAVTSALHQYERSAYCCSDCGRLLLEKRGDSHSFHSFVPDDPSDVEGVLRSKRQSQWPGILRGHWGAGSLFAGGGSIWWQVGDGESAIEDFSSWEPLAARYHEVFTAFQKRGVLRDAFLKKDGDIVHDWPGGER